MTLPLYNYSRQSSQRNSHSQRNNSSNHFTQLSLKNQQTEMKMKYFKRLANTECYLPIELKSAEIKLTDKSNKTSTIPKKRVKYVLIIE